MELPTGIHENLEALELNEFAHSGKGEVSRLHADGKLYPIANRAMCGIAARSLPQSCAVDVLLDTSVDLVSLMGKAGSGKTILAVAAGLHLVLESGDYSKLIIIRPIIPTGNDLGYMPGDFEDKMTVWAEPVIDALEVALTAGQKKYSVEYLKNSGVLEIIPPTYIRGRTLSRCVVVIDEAQSLSPHEMKTIVTRMGESSKLIVTGDIYQIDNLSLSETTNGFSHLVDKFKAEPLAAHIELTKCERSNLAARAAELL